MATLKPSLGNAQCPQAPLLARMLADALPKDTQVTLYHVSSNPSKCPAIFAAPPSSTPARTYCESQFITVSITPGTQEASDQKPKDSLVFAIEVLIYTTAQLTTLFVSKADSTGYLSLCDSLKAGPSLLKTISTTFISYLAQERRRPGIKLVISLFARAQGQYLFPGSVENKDKHVLDDRGLIRWWCRVLDPIVRERNGQPTPGGGQLEMDKMDPKGYVVVPGLDEYETQGLLPATARRDTPEQRRWVNDHPLRRISCTPNAPPRCLIPHFPDDPKARFLDELDEELPEASKSQTHDSPSKGRKAGHWFSVKTLEQFWDAMEFRQECSSGRLVGFLWVVFGSHKHVSSDPLMPNLESQASTQDVADTANFPPTPEQSQSQSATSVTPKTSAPEQSRRLDPVSPAPSTEGQPESRRPTQSRQKLRAQRKKPHKLTGIIKLRQPRVKTFTSRVAAFTQPIRTDFYVWPESSRGQVVLEPKEYHRIHEYLLRLDFANLEVSLASTEKWRQQVVVIGGLDRKDRSWGQTLTGRKVYDTVSDDRSLGATALTADQLRKRQGQMTGSDGHSDEGANRVNLLSVGLVRKKPKTNDYDSTSEVQVLGQGLVRKKPKT